ncbi:hypothetical protein [Streptomyces pseudovenezuelae]|uniref:hypothetical protein n=1 Tax=Streptomyces pseudovenezuelae TaxID=67350 RepID=UPI0036E1B3ED
MIAVAVSLLPALGVLLYAMDRVEDRLSARSPARSSAPRHARGRQLRLIRGGAPSRTEPGPAAGSERRLDAA